MISKFAVFIGGVLAGLLAAEHLHSRAPHPADGRFLPMYDDEPVAPEETVELYRGNGDR